MNIRTTIDIPEPLHNRLSRRAERSGVSVRSLILRVLEQAYAKAGKGAYVTGPMIPAQGKRGPAYPVDKNPHDLVFP